MKNLIQFMYAFVLVSIATQVLCQPPGKTKNQVMDQYRPSEISEYIEKTESQQSKNWSIVSLQIDINFEIENELLVAKVSGNSGEKYGYKNNDILAIIIQESKQHFNFVFFNKSGVNRTTESRLRFDGTNFFDNQNQRIICKNSSNPVDYKEDRHKIEPVQSHKQDKYFQDKATSKKVALNQSKIAIPRGDNFFENAEKEDYALNQPKKRKKRGFGNFLKGTGKLLGGAAKLASNINNVNEMMSDRTIVSYDQNVNGYGGMINQQIDNSKNMENEYLSNDMKGILETFIHITDGINKTSNGRYSNVQESNQRLKDIYSGDIYSEKSEDSMDFNAYTKKSIDQFESQYGDILNSIFPDRKTK